MGRGRRLTVANFNDGSDYVGMSVDIMRRLNEHRIGLRLSNTPVEEIRVYRIEGPTMDRRMVEQMLMNESERNGRQLRNIIRAIAQPKWEKVKTNVPDPGTPVTVKFRGGAVLPKILGGAGFLHMIR